MLQFLIQYLLFSPSASQISTINKCQYFFDISETYKCITFINREVCLQSFCSIFAASKSKEMDEKSQFKN